MVNLLPRFYDVTSGSVCIDGVDVRDLELDSLRDKIAIVFRITSCLPARFARIFCSARKTQRRKKSTVR